MRLIPHLLWIDSGAGLTVGVLVLALVDWLSPIFALPPAFLTVMGVANVAYGLFSLSLARRRTRPPALLLLLVVANASWAVLCALAAVVVAPYASPLGLAQLILEGLFVGGLAALEWRHRETLRVAGRA